MLFVGTSIIHPSTEGVFLLCNILDLLIYSKIENRNPASVIVFEMNEQGTAGPLPQPIAERSATDNRD